MKQDFERTEILGVNVDEITQEALFTFIFDSICNCRKVIISNVNVHAINLAYSHPKFRTIINSSQAIFCDGFGVKWAVYLFKGLKLHRFTPPDWFGRFAGECEKQGFSIFFLGSRQEVVEKAADILKETYPNLKIVGVHHGFFDRQIIGLENRQVVQMINSLRPDNLVVGFGMPIQEQWIHDNFDDLQTHILLPVGAFFDYFAGNIRRAPQWMTNHGLEWLGRLVIEPNRLWKRYIVGNPLFIWRVIKHHILGFPLPGEVKKDIQ